MQIATVEKSLYQKHFESIVQSTCIQESRNVYTKDSRNSQFAKYPEVSSSGDCIEDLLKLGIELAQVMPYETLWWKPLFAGYEREPDFDAFLLRLLGISLFEFWLAGYWMQTKDREKQMRRFLDARNWDELFLPVN